MEAKLLKIEEASSEQWDRIADSCEYATYFHTHEWAEIWHAYSDGKLKPAAKILTFSDGAEVLFPMSMAKVFRGLMHQYISSPENNYGGWLSVSELSLAHHKALWEYASNLNLIMRHNPYDKELQAAAKTRSWSFNDFTQALDLRQGYIAIEKTWKGRSIWRNLNVARRGGVVIEEGTTLEDWQEYYEVYQASVQRWGDNLLGNPYDWRLFKYMFDNPSEKRKLWVARIEEKVVAGGVRFYQSKHLACWQLSSLKEYAKSYPATMLHQATIEKACQEGYWWYDFNPSGGLEGVAAFKETFGCQKLEFNLFINKLAARKLIDNTKEIIAKRNLKVLSHR